MLASEKVEGKVVVALAGFRARIGERSAVGEIVGICLAMAEKLGCVDAL